MTTTIDLATRRGPRAPRAREWGHDRGLRITPGESPVGVEVTDRHVCAAQLVGEGSRSQPGVARLRIALRMPRQAGGPLGESEALALAGALRRAGVSTREVVLGAPDASLMTGLLELPPRSSKAPVEEIARMEMARMHRADPEGFAMACWDLPASDRAKGATHAMGLGLAHDAADASIDALEGAGLAVCALDARMCAFSRCVAAAMGHNSALAGVVEVGWEAAQILLLHSSGPEWTIAFERRVPEVSLAGLCRALEQRLGLDEEAAELALRGGAVATDLGGAPAETEDADPMVADMLRAIKRYQHDFFDRLVPEVQRSLVYATQRYPTQPMTRVQLVGEGARIVGLRSRIAQAMGVECGAVLPRDVVRVDASSALAQDGAVVGAIGLAAHALDGSGRSKA
jgi:Tfp pilus assembly PilM family ATPase